MLVLPYSVYVRTKPNPSESECHIRPTLPVLQFEAGPLIVINDEHLSAYRQARAIEALSKWPKELPPPDTGFEGAWQWPHSSLPPRIGGRLLGRLLTDAYLQDCANAIAKDINDCGDGAMTLREIYLLADLARFYSVTLLKTCERSFCIIYPDTYCSRQVKKYSGKTPHISHHSRESFEEERQNIEVTMEGRDEKYIQYKRMVSPLLLYFLSSGK